MYSSLGLLSADNISMLVNQACLTSTNKAQCQGSINQLMSNSLDNAQQVEKLGFRNGLMYGAAGGAVAGLMLGWLLSRH